MWVQARVYVKRLEWPWVAERASLSLKEDAQEAFALTGETSAWALGCTMLWALA